MKTIKLSAKYLKEAQIFYKDYCNKDNTILFESAEIVNKSGVQSIIGFRSCLKISCENLKVCVQSLNNNGRYLAQALAKIYKKELINNTFYVSFKRPSRNLDEFSRLKCEGPLDVMRSLLAIVKPCPDIFIAGVIAFDFINNFENIANVPVEDHIRRSRSDKKF